MFYLFICLSVFSDSFPKDMDVKNGIINMLSNELKVMDIKEIIILEKGEYESKYNVYPYKVHLNGKPMDENVPLLFLKNPIVFVIYNKDTDYKKGYPVLGDWKITLRSFFMAEYIAKKPKNDKGIKLIRANYSTERFEFPDTILIKVGEKEIHKNEEVFLDLGVSLHYRAHQPELKNELQKQIPLMEKIIVSVFEQKNINEIDTLEKQRIILKELEFQINQILLNGEIEGIEFSKFEIKK